MSGGRVAMRGAATAAWMSGAWSLRKASGGGRVAAVEAPDVRIQPSMHGPRYCAESTRMRYILYREGVSCVCGESACERLLARRSDIVFSASF